MALTERDSNEMAKPKDGKRKKVEIDLTLSDSDDDAPAPKAQKTGVERNVQRIDILTPEARKKSVDKNAQRNGSQSQRREPSSAYQTPPASSAIRSSQPSTSHFESTYGPSRSLGDTQTHNPHQDYIYGSGLVLADTQHSEAERNSWLAEDDEDFNEIVQSTQTAAADTEQLHHYGDLATKIVGVQYYRGHASAGEQILLRREPGNPYDSNAIRVDSVAGTQIGHIPRRIAEKLARFMDDGSLHVEGELAGQMGTFDCPLSLHTYGVDPQSEEGLILTADMKAAKLPLAALKAAEQREKQREKERKEAAKQRQREEKARLAEARRAAASGGTGNGARIPAGSQTGYVNQSQAGESSEPVMADILEASQRFNPREIGNSTDQYGIQEDDLKNMPLADPPKAIKTDMLPYQLQALKWLIDQENPQPPPQGSKEAVQLWKRNDRNGSLFTNIATTFSTQDTPTFASGGILADDMGLGKTVEMIALIVADNEKTGHKTGTTLIVSPLSVMSNWSGQISQHIHRNKALNVYIYHGAGRVKMNASDFSQYDVVITTYQTLASDYMPKGKGGRAPSRELRSSGLYSMEFRRVILDEGHTARNPASKLAGAVTAVHAKSRWALTGTPIVNSLKDLYSLLRFIGITGGLEQLEIFNRVLIRPLKQGDPSATYLLKAIMTSFTLRRRKEMAFIDLRLPKLDEYVHRITFTPKEKERYDAFTKEAQGLLKRYEKKGGGSNFQNLLEILLRMRQCCNHWQLCGERVTNLLAQLEEQKVVSLTPENTKALQDMLQLHIEGQEDCPICLETLSGPVITTCGHTFDKDCITEVLKNQKKCPMCRQELLNEEECLVFPGNECGDEAADNEMDLTQSSSKLETMMEILNATKASKHKTIIFSQWTRFLDIVQSRLDRDGYKYCRLDGTMSVQQRDGALHALDDDPECTIMLASLGVAAVGLNLTAASQVILSDTWWAPAIEDQAVDRVHRLGQRKETRVFRLVMDGTIEEQTIRIQKEKRDLMRLAFSEKEGKRDKVKNGMLADIRRLLNGPASTDNAARAGAST